MNHQATPAEVRLPRRTIRSFADAAGLALACIEGSLWVTLDGDPTDYILEEGESFTTQEHGRAVVYALEASRLGIEAAAPTFVMPQRAARGSSGLRASHA